MSEDNGGSAFPIISWKSPDGMTAIGGIQQGMTLRDYFAAKADLSKVEFSTLEQLANFAGQPAPTTDNEVVELAAKAAAKLRYIFADAMLEARK